MMEPYFQSDNAVLYHGKAETVLPFMAKGSVDLVAMDPPYGVKFRSNRGANFDPIMNDDKSLDMDAILKECCRCLRPFRHVYIFGGMGFGDGPIGGRSTLVWDKQNIGMGDLSLPWGPQHEIIDFGVYAPSKANRDRGDGALSARLRKGSVLRVLRPNASRVTRHPTEKPLDIMRALIESSSVVGDTVLDPFAGSGSTLVAAIILGRKAVGIELDEQYLPMAISRIEAAESVVRQLASL